MNSIEQVLYLAIGVSVLALVVAYVKAFLVKSIKVEHKRAAEIAGYIREGSMAFLRREFKVLSIVVLAISIILYFMESQSLKMVSFSFIFGAVFAALAGFIGMRVATTANVRTALVAKESLNRSLQVSFNAGSSMGLSVVGLGLLGIASLFLLFTSLYGDNETALKENILPIINGFVLGAAIVALFARVGGGIYTKAADVGADLVGKIEANIPEDDPRNPAVIADNVGDNVGDTAGMGSDLFLSYVASIASSMILGLTTHQVELVILPLVIALVGIAVSIVVGSYIRTSENGNPQIALNVVTLSATFVSILCLYPVMNYFINFDYFNINGKPFETSNLFYTIIVGMIAGVCIGYITEYYTKMNGGPVANIANASKTGHATNILAGLETGLMSTVLPVIVICLAIAASYYLADTYGIALASLGMLTTIGVQLAVDAYGPIADNAGGIAEMAELGADVRERTDKLDAVGNTTAAIGKGFAIGSAALTTIALFSAFEQSSNVGVVELNNPKVIIGALLGGVLPFLFAAMTIGAVGRAAFKIIEEVRRQFREIPGLMEGKANPDYSRCVDISTQASIREMMVPGLLAVGLPVVIGFGFGKEMLSGFLTGVTISGIMMAIFMSNAGGAWDNAKKFIEKGNHGGKGSDTHKAAVTGDTVGDPFKDTSGPSMNILIKIVAIVALILAPYL